MKSNPPPTTPDGSTEPALWRKHFPIEANADTSQSRRGFLGGVAIAGGAMACCQAVQRSGGSTEIDKENQSTDGAAASWQTYEPVTLEKKLHEIADGEAFLFHFPNHRSPCLLVKFSDSDFEAYSQKCTHLACPVIPEFEENKFHCPCHHGEFDLRTGEPLAGPPRRPLPKVCLELQDDGTLVANAMEQT